MTEFRKATRTKAKLRLGIVGAAGSGKTFSALLIAKGLGGKIAVVDTENGSADLYAGVKDIPEYDVLTMQQPYEVDKYLAAIDAAEKAGYNVLILDSISHAWSGEGGLLDQQGRIADSGKKNSYTAWRTITPQHNKFIERMLNANLHIIATMRAKTEYAIVSGDQGKAEVKKLGMAPIQREGMDYEFTVVFDIDQSHNVQASKDRTHMFNGKIFMPSDKTGEQLVGWLNTGGDAPAPKPPEKPAEKKAPASKKATEPKKPEAPATEEIASPETVTAIKGIIQDKKLDETKVVQFFVKRNQITPDAQGVFSLDGLHAAIGTRLINNQDAFISAYNKANNGQ